MTKSNTEQAGAPSGKAAAKGREAAAAKGGQAGAANGGKAAAAKGGEAGAANGGKAAAARREPPPTTKQIYALAREMFTETGRPWPGTRAEASELITHLREKNTA